MAGTSVQAAGCLHDHLPGGAYATCSDQLVHEDLWQDPVPHCRPGLSGQQANRVGRKSRGLPALSSELVSNVLDLTRRPLAPEQMVNLVVSFSGQMPQNLALKTCERQV